MTAKLIASVLENKAKRKSTTLSGGRFKAFPLYDYSRNGVVYNALYRVRCWWTKAGKAA